MDVSDVVSTEYVELPATATVSKLAGAFNDPSVSGVVVTDDDGYAGVVTRRQLAASHHPPEEKLRSLIWHVPKIAPDEDVREVAQLMIDGDSRIHPVFEGGGMVGVVTADDLLREVVPFLGAATVGDAYTDDLVSVDPGTTFGEVLHTLREHRVAHLPVVEDGSAVGILSLYDVVGIATRSIRGSQGGESSERDAFGGEATESAARSHGGFGAREGERERMLDLPVRDMMASPVRTITPDRTLEEAVEGMFDVGGSALVVTTGGSSDGIITKTDVLESLTWGAEGHRAVQVYGADFLDDTTYEDVVEMIERFDSVDSDMDVLDAKVHLHEHDETRRGKPLLLARIRLYTDRGLFMASGEGYGASHALTEARDTLERRIRDRKTHGRSKKHPNEEFWERRFGWWLEG